MDLGLHGRVAVVGGASQGIGRAVALALAAEGVHLGLCARREAPLAALCAEIEATHGVQTMSASVDVAEDAAVRGFVASVAERFERLDMCVPNAGGPPAKNFLETSIEEWDAAFRTNLRSVVSFAQACLPRMQLQRWGRIVTVTSYTAKQSSPGLVLSNAIRPGVAGLVRSLATEFGRDGVTVNNVGPGFTDTSRSREVLRARALAYGRDVEELRIESEGEIPIRRMSTPEEVAATVVWLCSEQSASTTGQTVLVDGGSYRGF